jgi:septum formation topological specificity factor MinE
MSNVGVSVSSRLFRIWQMLMIAERTLSGLAHPQKIEEMSKELTKVVEDFDRAMNVEALRLAQESSKHSSISI